jgi:hypothetical protein
MVNPWCIGFEPNWPCSESQKLLADVQLASDMAAVCDLVEEINLGKVQMNGYESDGSIKM